MPRYSTKLSRACEQCGQPIEVTQARLAAGRGRFCSQECLFKNRAENPRPMHERFWDKVDKDGPLHPYHPELGCCWLWTAATDKKTGYGIFRIGGRVNGKSQLAHRVAYRLTHGECPDELVIRHSCDNRPCVNPQHLNPGTHQDNSDDAVERDRLARGELSPLSRLTEKDVIEIRRLREEGAPLAQLAKRFNVGESNICAITKRRSWRRAP